MSRRTQEKRPGYWRLVWRQFRRNALALAGLAVIAALALVALFAPLLANDVPLYMVHGGERYILPCYFDYDALLNFDYKSWNPGEGDYALRPLVPHSPLAHNLRARRAGPSADHWFGTDDRGRDVLARMIWGTRISMSIGLVAVGISCAIGVVVGAAAGYYRGWVDVAALRVIEVMMCFPSFFLLLAVIAFLRPSIYNIMIVIGLTGWMGVARLVRGEFLRLRETEFAMAARATGLRDTRVMLRHILPNALAPVLVSAAFGVAGAVLAESGLSFLGFGVQPPTPSWGELLQQSQRMVATGKWWIVVYPGAAIFITVTAFNLVGEGLRDAMDPRLRQ